MKYQVARESDKQKVISIITGLNLESPKEIDIHEYHKVRTKEQNDKVHVMIREIALKLGYTPDEMKGIILFALGYYHEIQGKERTLMIFTPTHKMKVAELTGLIDQIYVWGSEKGIYLE